MQEHVGYELKDAEVRGEEEVQAAPVLNVKLALENDGGQENHNVGNQQVPCDSGYRCEHFSYVACFLESCFFLHNFRAKLRKISVLQHKIGSNTTIFQ
jgi:hypothetical protein